MLDPLAEYIGVTFFFYDRQIYIRGETAKATKGPPLHSMWSPREFRSARNSRTPPLVPVVSC